jgi:hypothetical protein
VTAWMHPTPHPRLSDRVVCMSSVLLTWGRYKGHANKACHIHATFEYVHVLCCGKTMWWACMAGLVAVVRALGCGSATGRLADRTPSAFAVVPHSLTPSLPHSLTPSHSLALSFTLRLRLCLSLSPLSPLLCSPSGDFIVSGSECGGVYVWRTKNEHTKHHLLNLSHCTKNNSFEVFHRTWRGFVAVCS